MGRGARLRLAAAHSDPRLRSLLVLFLNGTSSFLEPSAENGRRSTTRNPDELSSSLTIARLPALPSVSRKPCNRPLEFKSSSNLSNQQGGQLSRQDGWCDGRCVCTDRNCLAPKAYITILQYPRTIGPPLGYWYLQYLLNGHSRLTQAVRQMGK